MKRIFSPEKKIVCILLQLMTTSFLIQRCSAEHYAAISRFIWEIYQEEIAAINREKGHENFRAFISETQIRNRARQGAVILEAMEGGSRIGICEYRHQHIFLLFTHPSHRYRGVARELMQVVKEDVEQKGFSPFLSLQASPNSLPFYQHLGFLAIGSETEQNGLRTTLMKLSW